MKTPSHVICVPTFEHTMRCIPFQQYLQGSNNKFYKHICLVVPSLYIKSVAIIYYEFAFEILLSDLLTLKALSTN